MVLMHFDKFAQEQTQNQHSNDKQSVDLIGILCDFNTLRKLISTEARNVHAPLLIIRKMSTVKTMADIH